MSAGRATSRPRRRFPDEILAALRDGKILRIRAGIRPHRYIGIWVVVVGKRVFVRSWSLKPRSWWRTCLTERRGSIQVGSRTIAIRTSQIRSESVRDAVSGAYLDKYGTGASRRYALDLGSPESRATTTELLPL